MPADPTAPRRTVPAESRATADLAVEGRPNLKDSAVDAPYSRPAPPLEDGRRLDQLAEKKEAVGDADEALIDEAVEESFPASDPPSITPRGR